MNTTRYTKVKRHIVRQETTQEDKQGYKRVAVLKGHKGVNPLTTTTQRTAISTCPNSNLKILVTIAVSNLAEIYVKDLMSSLVFMNTAY